MTVLQCLHYRFTFWEFLVISRFTLTDFFFMFRIFDFRILIVSSGVIIVLFKRKKKEVQ